MKNPERLHEHPCFEHFNALELHQLVECTAPRSGVADEVLFDEGDRSADFYLLEEGKIRLSRATAFGDFTLSEPRAGDVFGAACFVDGSPQDGCAVAVEPSQLVTFQADALKAACERSRKFELSLYWSLWKILSRHLRQTNSRLGQFFSAETHLPGSMTPAAAPLGSPGTFDLSTKVSLFREQRLSPMEINFLASLSQEERFEPGQTIFREGEKGTKMYVVAEGRVMISKTISGVGEEALAFLERGDYFGEMALIDKELRSADARAHPQTGALVLALPRDVVEGILDIGRVSSIRLLKLLCGLGAKRAHELNEKLVGWFLLAGGDLSIEPHPFSD